MFNLGENLLMNECNMFTIIETLMKIKASLVVMIGDDHKKQMMIQKTYLNMATLDVPANEHRHSVLDCHEHLHTEFMDFLTRDERHFFIDQMNLIILKQIKAGFKQAFVRKKKDPEQGDQNIDS